MKRAHVTIFTIYVCVYIYIYIYIQGVQRNDPNDFLDTSDI